MTRNAMRKRAARARARGGAPRVEPDRRVPFDHFPTPEGMRPTWRTVTGGSLPSVEWPHRAAGSTERPANLAAALDYHPDLLTALAGLLTDSWVPHSRGASHTTSVLG